MGLPRRELNLADDGCRLRVFDPLRRRWVAFTDEEEVRQQLILHLVDDLGFPPMNLAVEREIRFEKLRKRFDLVAYGPKGLPLLACECKAPSVRLNDDVWFQLTVYNATLRAPWLLLTNGPELRFAAASQPDAVQDWLPSWAALREA